MTSFRYVVIGGATLAWAGCSELPSFPESFGPMGGSSSGGSKPSGAGSGVIPNAGSSNSSAAGSNGTGSGGSASAMGGGAGSSSGAGSSVTGGSAGSSAAGGSAGSDTGPDPAADIADAVKNLRGWRYQNQCGYVDGHALNDGTCNSGEICWPNAGKARFSERKEIPIGGTAGRVYEVELRVRGALEPRDYPQNCERLPGAPDNTVGVLTNCDGFANQAAVTFNVFELKVQAPPAVYYLNGVSVHPPHRVDPIDQTFTIKVEGGTTVGFFFDDLNGGEIRNCSITVEGIEPYPKVFDGNFFQLDVLDAKIAE